MTATKATKNTRKQSPAGCTSPVMTHLTPAERTQLGTLAKRNMRSISATVRLLVVQGMKQTDTCQ